MNSSGPLAGSPGVLLGQLQERAVCPICQEIFGRTVRVVTRCDHVFHLACLKAMFDESGHRSRVVCPICRSGLQYGGEDPGVGHHSASGLGADLNAAQAVVGGSSASGLSANVGSRARATPSAVGVNEYGGGDDSDRGSGYDFSEGAGYDFGDDGSGFDAASGFGDSDFLAEVLSGLNSADADVDSDSVFDPVFDVDSDLINALFEADSGVLSDVLSDLRSDRALGFAFDSGGELASGLDLGTVSDGGRSKSGVMSWCSLL